MECMFLGMVCSCSINEYIASVFDGILTGTSEVISRSGEKRVHEDPQGRHGDAPDELRERQEHVGRGRARFDEKVWNFMQPRPVYQEHVDPRWDRADNVMQDIGVYYADDFDATCNG